MTISHIQLQTGPQVFVDDGGGAGYPLIFSHGLFMDHSMFAPQVAHFAPKARCITWDERAHGGTRWDGPFDYWDSARDLLALMDALDIDRAVHVGMSQGGLLGMRAALLAPDRFAGIVQLATQAGNLSPEAVQGFRAYSDPWIQNGISPVVIDFLTDLILGPGVDKRYWHDYWSRLTSRQVENALSALFSIDELYDRLSEISVPLCTIHGLADVSTPHALAERVAAAAPHAWGVTLIEDGPHAVNLTHADSVNAAIDRFMDRLRLENRIP